MQTLYIVLILIGVIVGLMVLLVLLESLTKEPSSEEVVKTTNEKSSTCGSGGCSACSFQLFETKDKKTKGDSSCNIY